MKTKWTSLLVLSLLAALSLACANSAPAVESSATPVPATSTPDVQATINSALEATSQAQANLQATVGAAVSATVIAMPPTATPIPPVEYVALTEEELEALIDEAVNEAVAATTQATTATTQTTNDDALTADEVDYLMVYALAAEQAIYYAEDLLQAYYSIYGDLAYAAIAEVEQLEQELAYMADSINALTTALQEINTTIQAGQQIAQETIDQLESAAQTASAHFSETQAQLQEFHQLTQQDRENRVNEILAIQPEVVPTDLQSTLLGAFSFVDQVKLALQDNQFSREELFQVAQLGANISAGFNAHGGPAVQGFSGKINEITLQLAKGQLPEARAGIGSFETSLGQRPAGNFQPGGLQPGGGGLPKPGRP